MTSIDFEVFYPHIKEVAVEVGCAPVQPSSFLLAGPVLTWGSKLPREHGPDSINIYLASSVWKEFKVRLTR